jgi:PHD/YefM family antitoxin component YafN of YafNO toxin-antitoxin module
MSGKEQLSLLNLKGKILFSDEVVSVRKLTILLNNLLENFTEKLFISKNNKIEAIILPIEEYEKMQDYYEKFKILRTKNANK